MKSEVFKNPKKCGSCRAFTSGKMGGICDLGYSIKKKNPDHLFNYDFIPSEPCPKPITVIEYAEAMQYWRKN